MTIRLITFDLDGTLWPIDDVLLRAHRELMHWILPRVPQFSQIDDARLNEIRLDVMETKAEIAHDISAVRIATLVAAFQEIGCSQADATELAKEAFEKWLGWRIQVTPYAGVRPTLECLKARYTLGTLTNGNADVMATPLKHCFMFNLSAAGVGALKPDPTMFELALELAGASPTQAVHIGDNVVDDIEAANDVGMHTIWVDYAKRGTDTSATATAQDFDDIPTILADF